MKMLMLLMPLVLRCSVVEAQQVVEVSTGKTVSLLLPAPVSYVDLGTTHIAARLVGPGSKVVLVKALEADFGATNLTIVTNDDAVFSFLIKYSPDPVNYQLIVQPPSIPSVNYAAGIMDNKPTATGMAYHKDGLYAQVQGLYVRDSLVFLHLKVSNTSSLTYNIETFRFSIANTKSTRRVASQQLAITPISIEGEHKQVSSAGSAVMVAVLPKVALSGKQVLHIELFEREGNRNLMLRVPARKLARAIPLPAL